jgi:hypothetical protein
MCGGVKESQEYNFYVDLRSPVSYVFVDSHVEMEACNKKN